jgi:SpoU rRNA methylase family enzyme
MAGPRSQSRVIGNAMAVRRVLNLSYAAYALFALEFVSLFAGATTFLRGITILNILAHGTGLVLMVLLQIDVSDLGQLG